MAGLIHVLAVFLLVAVIPAATASGLSSFWQHHLPHTAMPGAFEKLASPLSVSRIQHYATQLQAGNLQASLNEEFCSSARIYCQEAATIVGIQPRVCIPPFFLYSYNLLPCNQGSGSAVAAGSSAVEASSSSIFFLQKSLSVGNAVQLPDTSNDLKGLRFLPHALSESLPEITVDNLPELSRIYGVSKGSDMALDMQNTATYCSFKSDHEVQACLTSAETMVSFVSEKVGRNAVAIAPPAMAKQEATVLGSEVVSSKGGKVASCHDMKFPSLLFTCHMTQTSQVMNVALKLADGAIANLPAICHTDTSYWSPSHIAFQALNTKPGASSICHWLPENSFIFMEAAN